MKFVVSDDDDDDGYDVICMMRKQYIGNVCGKMICYYSKELVMFCGCNQARIKIRGEGGTG